MVWSVPELRDMPFDSTERLQRLHPDALNVHLLVTVRNEELLRASTLVFDSIRTGFPTAKIRVTLNNMSLKHETDVNLSLLNVASEGSAVLSLTSAVSHHEWILNLLATENDPFWICDTDIVFWDNFECFDFSGCAMAGRYVPQFKCDFAKAITRPRLHTCLLYLDPMLIKQKVKEYGERFPEAYCLPRPTLQDLVFPRYVPQRFGALDKTAFYDTCAGLFHAIGGRVFADEHNFQFDHLNFGTLSDVVATHYPGCEIRESHFAAFQSPSILKGQWQRDAEFYRNRAC